MPIAENMIEDKKPVCYPDVALLMRMYAREIVEELVDLLEMEDMVSIKHDYLERLLDELLYK